MKTVIRPEAGMKDSGIDWIGEIPNSWELGKVKYAFYRKKGKSTEKDPTVLSLARTGVRIRDISTNEGQLATSYEGYNPVEPGDLLLNPMDLISGANCSISMVSGVISPAYINLRAKIGFEPRYYDYYFKIQYWNMGLFAHGKGVSFENRWTLNDATFKDYYIPMPVLSEQQTIANYLDETCSKIDEIIAEAKASIDEYKELKQSIIFEAVTKGLDKNVEMKDSENLAIGKIPKHWIKAKVKNVVTRITVGVVVTPANYFNDAGTVAFLRGINVKEYVINSEPMMYITEETNKQLSKTIVHTNDLVIVRDGAIGVTAVVPAKYDGANVVSMIIVSLGSEYNHDYLCYVLNSYVGKIQFNLTKIGSALSHTSVSSVSNIEIPKPSINEQINIVNYLKEQHKKLNSLITEKQSLIADLEAYKKSLIYEVVTGKRKVV